MATLIEKIDQGLSASLSGYVTGLEEVAATGRVIGFVVSPDFEDVDQAGRQDRLKRELASILTDEEIVMVGPIVTMTPEEAAIHEDAD